IDLDQNSRALHCHLRAILSANLPHTRQGNSLMWASFQLGQPSRRGTNFMDVLLAARSRDESRPAMRTSSLCYGFGPVARKFATLLSASNQNGAPSEPAMAVIKSPEI